LFFALGGRNPIEAVPGFELLAEGDSPRLGARDPGRVPGFERLTEANSPKLGARIQEEPQMGFFTLYPKTLNPKP